jgi:hypothetical protein
MNVLNMLCEHDQEFLILLREELKHDQSTILLQANDAHRT